MGKGCKVVVCGQTAVGKTAIVEQLLYGNHSVGSESSETQEDVYVASVETDRGVKEQLRLYDTKGLHDGQDLPKHYYSVADGFVLVYSVDSLESFKRVDALKKEIDKSRDKKENLFPHARGPHPSARIPQALLHLLQHQHRSRHRYQPHHQLRQRLARHVQVLARRKGATPQWPLPLCLPRCMVTRCGS
ncbi:NF-kappa-B inhibitor-interacting Ras-like protein 1 isoform 2-T2 [Pholidichthys leucotaenia]